jgi:heavy metal sensor kinase
MQTSIRFRLTAWYVTALAFTLVLLGAAAYLLTQVNLQHWLDETLQERAEALSEALRLVDGEPRLDLSDDRYRAYEGIGDGYLILDGSHGVALARGLDTNLFSSAAAVTAGFTGVPATGTVTDGRGRRWRLATHPVLSGGRTAAVVAVAHDLHEVDEVLGRLSFVMMALLPIALLGAGLGGFALAGRALAPVDRIRQAAAEISEKDLSRRLPVGARDELGRLAATFNALIERLEKAFERQRQFTADASHELRTPLSVIRAITSQRGPEGAPRRRHPEEYEEALRQIDEASAYMAKLVSHLLTLARADAGQLQLEREALNLSELLEHVAAQVGEAASRAIPVLTDGTVWVEADPLRLTELFLNLLENATKYTPPEGSVEVRVRRIGLEAEVIVEDAGIGIPPDQLAHIFERFYRVDGARAREEGGAGLGLAIARWIAEAHHGTVRARSVPGRGTTMTVRLPAMPEEAD